MSNGPSKEQLEMYWKSSRQYFDELAKHYKTADPAYYDQFIAPYYSNPFSQVSSAGSGKGIKRTLLFSIAIFIMVLTAGIAMFFVTTKEQEKSEYKNTGKQIETSKDNNANEESKTIEKDIESIFSGDDFIIGSKYLAEKDYDKAEEHFRKIKPGEKNYKEAQQLLESIKYIRKYGK